MLSLRSICSHLDAPFQPEKMLRKLSMTGKKAIVKTVG